MRTRIAIVGFVLLLTVVIAVPGQAQSTEMNVSAAVPMVSVETSVPAEINIGSTAQFVITVKNTGKSPAEGVSVQSTIPATVDFLRAVPKPSLTADRLVQFEIGDLPAGDSRRITMDLLPTRHGPVDLATRAFFATTTQSALNVRQPEIVIDCHADKEAVLGEEVTFCVVVRNVGDGPAQDVVIKPIVPEAAHIRAKTPATIKIPALAPNGVKEYCVVARAIDVEYLQGGFVVSAQGLDELECGNRVKILRPRLDVEVDGSHVTYLKREGKYAVRVWNPGDTVLDGVKVVLALSEGLQVTTLSSVAHVDAVENTLVWCVGVLQPGEERTFMLKAKANKVGTQVQVASADAKTLHLAAADDHRTVVVTRSELDVAVLNTQEAIEVGETEEFTIWLRNLGSKVARNVSVRAELPRTLLPVASENYTATEQRLVYPAFDLPPGEEKSLKFTATSLNTGEYAVQAVVQSDGAALPTNAETTVYFFDDAELERLVNGNPSVGVLR